MIFNGSSPPSNNPWIPSSTENESNKSKVNSEDNNFEDNFVEKSDDSKSLEKSEDCLPNSVDSKPFEKLEDSDEYLASLERKLSKLTNPNPKNAEKSLLKSLSERRSDEARRYLVKFKW